MSDRASGESSKFVVNTVWSFVMVGGQQVVALAVSLLLAAMLGPEVFGLSAMAMVYIGLLDIIQRQGLSPAIIQRRDLSTSHLNAAFWMQVWASLLVTAAGVALAGWWAGVNDAPQLEYVIYGMTPLLLIGALSAIQSAYLLRQQRMRVLTLRSGVSVTVGGVAGIAAAVAGLGIWSLVIQQLVTASVALIVLWSASGWRPTFSFSPRAARDLLNFSSGSFLSVLSGYLSNRGDAIVLGIFVNPAAVGLYRLGARLVESAYIMASRPVQVLALPVLSEEQDDSRSMRRTYRRLTKVSAGGALPVLAILAGCAVPLVSVLGEEWLPAAGALQWLTLAGAVRALTVANSPMLQAMGRPHLNAIFGWALAVTSIGAFVVVGSALPSPDWPYAATAMAAARSLIAVVIYLIYQLVFLRVTRIPLLVSLRAWTPAIWSATVAALASWAVSSWVLGSLNSPWIALVLGGLSGGVAAAGAMMMDPDSKALLLSSIRKVT